MGIGGAFVLHKSNWRIFLRPFFLFFFLGEEGETGKEITWTDEVL